MTSRTTGYDPDFRSLTVSQLRDELKKRGQSTKGLKKDLVRKSFVPVIKLFVDRNLINYI